MRTRLPWLLALFVCALVGAAPASAFPLTVCEEDEPAPVAEQPARLILPCAVAERALLANQDDGELGCADASVYVVTHSGVLLCEFDVPALAAATAPTLERAPSATLASSSAFSAAGLAPALTSVLPPLVVELPRARAAADARPLEGFTRPPSVPS